VITGQYCVRGTATWQASPNFPLAVSGRHDAWEEELLITSATVDSTPCRIVISVTAFLGPM